MGKRRKTHAESTFQAKPPMGVQDYRGAVRASIDERPKIDEEKSQAGNWEGDAGKNACLSALGDRKTKLLPAGITPDNAASRQRVCGAQEPAGGSWA
jgi:IS30 family transposase